MFIIVSYDIIDDKKRDKICNILKDYCKRLQYSVFECDLTEKLFEQMIKKLKTHINEGEDSLIIIHLCEACKKKIMFIGVRKSLKEDDFLIF